MPGYFYLNSPLSKEAGIFNRLRLKMTGDYFQVESGKLKIDFGEYGFFASLRMTSPHYRRERIKSPPC